VQVAIEALHGEEAVVLTYTMLNGETLDLSELPEREREFFEQCVGEYLAGIEEDRFATLITGTANPLSQSGGGITRRAAATPLFQALRDMQDRLGIAQGRVAPEPGDLVDLDPLEDTLLTVAEAAERAGATVSGLHQAIRRKEVIAHPAKPGGSWLRVSGRSLERWHPHPVRQAAALSRGSQ
jgi:hypothetical protein